MIGGLPGSGKSYLANALSKKINAVHLSSDLVRKDLNKRGKYDFTDKEIIYTQMKRMLNDYLINGKNVIVDTTFYKSKLRNEIIEIAKRNKSNAYFIITTAPEETIKERVSKKRNDSEADFEVYKLVKGLFDPVHIDYLELNTSDESLEELINKVIRYCKI